MPKPSKLIECGSFWLQGLCFLYCVTLPSDSGNVAIRTDLARNGTGSCCGVLPDCLHGHLFILPLTVLSHSAGVLDRLTPWMSGCFCVVIDATCPCGHKMLGKVILQKPTPPQTRSRSQGALGCWFSSGELDPAERTEPWPTLFW